MNRQELINDIKYIKEVISNSTYYTNLSGIAAIISGAVAIAGCSLSQSVLGEWSASPNELTSHLSHLTAIWLAVFAISVAIHIYFIVRKAKKTGQPAWSRLAKLIVYALSPPLLLGACITVFLIYHQKLLLVPATWMIAYGLGVWSAALFSIPEPRWLGASFMVTGVLTLFCLQDQSLLMMAVSFGIFHIAYGIRLYVRYGG